MATSAYTADVKLSSAEMNAAGAAIRALCAPSLLLTLASYAAALPLAERHHF